MGVEVLRSIRPSVHNEVEAGDLVLTLLDLSSNSLKSIEWHIFTGLDSLEVLLLYNNHLESISGSMRLHKLRSLYLSNNQLHNFPEGLLSPKDRPQTLRVVDLSYNHLQDLPIEKMKDLPLSFSVLAAEVLDSPECSPSSLEL
uniref:Uncharacterized protein n=1 Tax=Eptatretus burgeri TaxID=7764 RepID=A0A8C4WY51_EPTBU